MPQIFRRLGSLTPRCRKDTVVPFTESTEDASTPSTKAARGDEIRYGSPTRCRVQAFAESPVGSAKKPRLCQSEENPNMIAATPTSSSKKQRLCEGGILGASPMSNSSKKPRLSPLNHTPRVATSPTMGAMTPAESPPLPGESPPPPAMHSGMRNSAATPCRPPVLPPNVGQLPAYPGGPQLSLNLQGISGSASENAQTHRKQLEFENVDMTEEAKDPFSMRASCPAALSTAPATSTVESLSKAESHPKRPQTARPPARPLSGFLSGVVGRLMSPRRMMSPARVNSPRRDPLPPAGNPSAAGPWSGPAGTTSQDPSSASSKRASRGWFPSPRRRETTSSKPAAEVQKEGSCQAVQTPRGFSPGIHTKYDVATVAADPVEALVHPMLSAVYGRALSSEEISAATTACPEITWLAQCATLCPLPIGWRAVPAEDATGTPALYACELTGEITEQPPHLPRFSKLARLLMHAVTHPSEAHTAVAWLKVEIEDAHAECTRLQESWCRSIDPSTSAEFWHNPMTGKSSWDSPAAPCAFAAAVAERVLDTEPFKAVRATEAAQGRASSMTPKPPPQEVRTKSQSTPSRQRAGSQHAPCSSTRGYRTESSDASQEQPVVHSARQRSSHEQRSRDAPSSARRDRPDTNRGEETPRRRRTSHEQRSRQTPGSARGHRGEIFDLYEEDASMRSSRRRDAPEQRSKQARAQSSRSEVFDVYEEDAPMRSSRRRDAPEQQSKQARAQSSRGEVFDLYEETPTPSNRKRRQHGKHESSSSDSEEESADPEVFNMATPPRKEPPSSQANSTSTDAAVALAGAAAALATAAAALSARGPSKDESMDTSRVAVTPAQPSARSKKNRSTSAQEMHRRTPREVVSTMCETSSMATSPQETRHQIAPEVHGRVVPEVSLACEETAPPNQSPPKAKVPQTAPPNQSPPKAKAQMPETDAMLQFPEVQATPSASASSSTRAAPQQDKRQDPQRFDLQEPDDLAESTVPLAAPKVAPPPPPPPPVKLRAKSPAPPPPTDVPQGVVEAAIASAARSFASSNESECDNERKQVLQEVDSILLSARGTDKPKAAPSAPPEAESSFSLSMPSMPTMPEQVKASASEGASDEKLQTALHPSAKPLSVPSMPAQAKAKTSEAVVSQEKLQTAPDPSPSKPAADKKPSSIPKVKLPSSIPPGVGIKGKSVPGIPAAVTSSCGGS